MVLPYDKQNWDTTSYVNPTRMNHIEDGIENALTFGANSFLGAKNLNSTPYFHGTSRENNGVTFTVNADGSISTSGTATGGNAQFQCHPRTQSSATGLVLPNGDYILSGCPSGGSNTKYFIQALRTSNGSASVYGYDYGSGKELTLNGDDYSNDEVNLGIYINVQNGQNANGLVFRPMIRLKGDNDSSWQPYSMTNQKLTEVAKQVIISKRYLKKSEDSGNTFYLQGKTNTWFKVCFAYSEYNVLFTSAFTYNTVVKIGGETVEVTVNTETGVVGFSGNNSSIRNATNVLVEEIPI